MGQWPNFMKDWIADEGRCPLQWTLMNHPGIAVYGKINFCKLSWTWRNSSRIPESCISVQAFEAVVDNVLFMSPDSHHWLMWKPLYCRSGSRFCTYLNFLSLDEFVHYLFRYSLHSLQQEAIILASTYIIRKCTWNERQHCKNSLNTLLHVFM